MSDAEFIAYMKRMAGKRYRVTFQRTLTGGLLAKVRKPGVLK